MSLKSNLAKSLGLGVVLAVASASASMAATASHGTPVHSRPSWNSAIVNYLHRGEHARLIAVRGPWCEVSIPGPDGWVACSTLGSYPLRYFRPGIEFNFGFPIPFPFIHHYPSHPPYPPPHPPGPPMPPPPHHPPY